MPTMKPISAAEMASLRADIAALACDTSCIVKRPVLTPDGRLTNTVTLSTITTVNVGMKQPSAAQCALFAGKIGNSVAWQVKFPTGTDVQSGDHLVIGSNTLVVEADLSPQSYSTLNTYLAVEIK
jgi:hypothetical protein